MSADVEADTVIVGSGVAGTLVARAVLAAGDSVALLERGALVPWEQQMERMTWEADVPGAEHNHENDPAGEDWPWTYVYGVGGSCLRWAGVSPRLIPEDFEMRTRFGVMRDWPFGYEELAPFYAEAERILGVAGPRRSEIYPPPAFALPPHEPSPQDRAVGPLLEPFVALPQARPTRNVGTRPPCCGSARCQLCPVNSRFSVLNGLQATLEHDRLELLPETVAARVVSDSAGRRVTAVEAIGADGERHTVRGRRFVVAANGIESAGLLLRSELDAGDTGRNLFDHPNAALEVETRSDLGVGHGRSLATGASYRYYTGDFRRDRAAALLVVSNPGAIFGMAPQTVDLLMAGRTGRALRREVAGTWNRTVKLEVYMDDVPQPGNRVVLSSSKDGFGLPRNRVRYRRATPYLQRGLDHVIEDAPKRLAPLGVVRSRFDYAIQGAHMIGTLRMGDDRDAVVDADCRHRLRENLFVAGSAVFPTFSPANPTATIAALAVRLGRTLAREVA
jgi:choline dehydrogenase-like flavoprotein